VGAVHLVEVSAIFKSVFVALGWLKPLLVVVSLISAALVS